MNPHAACPRRRSRPRGIALMLAMIAVTLAMVLVMGFALTQQTAITISRNAQLQAPARLTAEAGLNMALSRIAADPAWRTSQANGLWVNGAAIAGGTLTLRGEDGIYSPATGAIVGDDSLSNNPTHPLTLTATGAVGGVTHTARVSVFPTATNNAAIVLVVPDATSLGTGDARRKETLEAWGFSVSLLSAGASQATYDAAIAAAEIARPNAAVYVSATCAAIDVATKLNACTLGVVCEQGQLVNDLGITSAEPASVTATNVTVMDITRYPTANLTKVSTAIAASAQPMWNYSGTLAAGAILAARASGVTTPGMIIVETGVQLIAGQAAGRRVMLPWGGGAFDFASLNNAGQTILVRSLEWAAQSPSITTAGYTSVFTGSARRVAGRQYATQVSLAQAATVTGITAYNRGNAGTLVRYAIYSDLAGEPGSLLLQTNTAAVSATAGWLTINTTPTPLPAGTYWLAFSFNDATQYYYYNNKSGKFRYLIYTAVPSGFKAAWGASRAAGTRRISIYMNLNNAGVGGIVNNAGLPMGWDYTSVWIDQP